MSLIINEQEVCYLGTQCPYNTENQCWGARPGRDTKFVCSYVENGKIVEGGMRNRYDRTGNMKIIME